jgi:ADP-ribosylglycohydrolase
MRGVLLGTAVGDALGLPLEGLGPRRARKLFPPPTRHRLLPGGGLLSDDTEHALFVAQSLLAHPASPGAFRSRLGWCLRGWLVGLPAGVGLATLRACVKLLVGFPPSVSGVYSAGNGPAMRAAPVGAFFCRRAEDMEAYLVAATRITHTDPKALVGARAVALAAAWSVGRGTDLGRPGRGDLEGLLRQAGGGEPEWAELADGLLAAEAEGLSVGEYAVGMGLGEGVTGYVYHTVPVALYAWYRHFGDFAATVESVLELGGDADTVGAVTGALAGAAAGASGIPDAWIDGIVDWPRSTRLLTAVADGMAQLQSGGSARPMRYFWPAVLPRNVFLLGVVLAHGLRRLLPPY